MEVKVLKRPEEANYEISLSLTKEELQQLYCLAGKTDGDILPNLYHQMDGLFPELDESINYSLRGRVGRESGRVVGLHIAKLRESL